MDNPITVPLPQDLPTNWTTGQTIGPNGTDVGLSQQYGYNYLMQQVNAAQQAAEELGTGFSNLTASSISAAPSIHASQHASSGSDPISPESIGAATEIALSNHVNNTSNPHQVTAAQVGAATSAALSSHIEDTSNPHQVTISQIGAAPAGYGLGGTTVLITDANNAIENGWYGINTQTQNLPEVDQSGVFDYCFLRVDCGTRKDTYIKQTICTPFQIWRGCEITRCFYNGTWLPWEWVNPPMLVGTEYRTVERYQGKPVYVQMVNFGALPQQDSPNKVVSLTVENVDSCFIDLSRSVITAVDTFSTGNPVSSYLPFPKQGVEPSVNQILITKASDVANTLRIAIQATMTDPYNGTATICAKYTKTTD